MNSIAYRTFVPVMSVSSIYAKNRKIKDFSLRNFKELDGDIIPPNNFVVLNDHDNNQHDSRQFGLIDQEELLVI